MGPASHTSAGPPSEDAHIGGSLRPHCRLSDPMKPINLQPLRECSIVLNAMIACWRSTHKDQINDEKRPRY